MITLEIILTNKQISLLTQSLSNIIKTLILNLKRELYKYLLSYMNKWMSKMNLKTQIIVITQKMTLI